MLSVDTGLSPESGMTQNREAIFIRLCVRVCVCVHACAQVCTMTGYGHDLLCIFAHWGESR